MDELASKLQEYLSVRRNNDSIRIEEFGKLEGGSEIPKYTFVETSTVNKKKTSIKFVLRMYLDILPNHSVKNEFSIMDRLYNEGFPVPRVILYEEADSILGGPFLIMDYVEHTPFLPKIMDAAPDQQEYWMRKFTELLVRLHQLDWKKIIIDKEPKILDDPHFTINALLTKYIEDWEEHGLTLYKTTVDWLHKQKENHPVEKMVFTHRDYHFHNVIVTENDSLCLVDWNNANVGDIRTDIVNPLNVFRLIKQDDLGNLFLELYEEISGETIGDLSFYEVLSLLQLAIYCVYTIGWLENESKEDKRRQNEWRSYLENMYEFLVERTQIRIPEIEELLG